MYGAALYLVTRNTRWRYAANRARIGQGSRLKVGGKHLDKEGLARATAAVDVEKDLSRILRLEVTHEGIVH
jgi:hypothetical protein